MLRTWRIALTVILTSSVTLSAATSPVVAPCKGVAETGRESDDGSGLGSGGADTDQDDGSVPVAIPDSSTAVAAAEDAAYVGDWKGTAGESLDFGLEFKPRFTGLQDAKIRIESDDPAQRSIAQSVVGTGLAARGTAFEYGGDYFAFEVEGSEPVLAVSGPNGRFEVDLPADSRYRLTVFEPESGLVAHDAGRTAKTGESTVMMGIGQLEAQVEIDGVPGRYMITLAPGQAILAYQKPR